MSFVQKGCVQAILEQLETNKHLKKDSRYVGSLPFLQYGFLENFIMQRNEVTFALWECLSANALPYILGIFGCIK